MEFLDKPVIRIALVALAVVMLIKWLISIIPQKYKRKPSPARSLQLDGLINKLSRIERAEVKQHMAENRKILAIKYFRAVTKTGLREAKEAVERLADED